MALGLKDLKKFRPTDPRKPAQKPAEPGRRTLRPWESFGETTAPPEEAAPASGENLRFTGDKPGTPTGDKPGTPTGDKPGTPTGDKPGTPTGDKPGTPTGDKPGTALTSAGDKAGTPVATTGEKQGTGLVATDGTLATGLTATGDTNRGQTARNRGHQPGTPTGDNADIRTGLRGHPRGPYAHF